MRRQFLLASVGAIALAGSAFAADLPLRAPPPAYVPPVPIFSWTGLYLGGQIGYAWGDDNQIITLTGVNLAAPALDPRGVIGGAHAGYNLQIGQWVAGLEGTVDGTSMSDSAFPLTTRTRSEIQGSIRARAGFAWDRVLIYGTGGAAFAGIDNFYALGAPFFASERITKTRSGWTAGGGIEYALTNNWSVRAEYRYSDFGRYNDFPFTAVITTVPPVAFGGGILSVQHHFFENQVQVGVSYKFDSLAPAPVVATY